jgi:H+/Cl- antiporter ClcA
MRARVSRIMACLCFALGGVLLVEACLGHAVLPWEEPDATTGTAALVVLVLGLFVGFAGEFAALRERVDRLEQARRQGPNL